MGSSSSFEQTNERRREIGMDEGGSSIQNSLKDMTNYSIAVAASTFSDSSSYTHPIKANHTSLHKTDLITTEAIMTATKSSCNVLKKTTFTDSTTNTTTTINNDQVATITPSQPSTSTSTLATSTTPSSYRLKCLGKRKFEILRAISIPTLSSSSLKHNNARMMIQPKSLKFEESDDVDLKYNDGPLLQDDTTTNDKKAEDKDTHHGNKLLRSKRNDYISVLERQSTVSSVAQSTSSSSPTTTILNQETVHSNKNNKVAKDNQLSSSKHPPIIERLEYVPSDIPNFFWHCPNCIHLPFSKRPKHSVVFHHANNSRASSDDIGKGEGGAPPPSSDTYHVIAIHSYLCKLKCNELKVKKMMRRMMKNRSGNDDDADDEEEEEDDDSLDSINSSTGLLDSSDSDEDMDEKDDASSFDGYNTANTRKSRRLSKKKKREEQDKENRLNSINVDVNSWKKKSETYKEKNTTMKKNGKKKTNASTPSVTPKRKRGRPRKNDTTSTSSSGNIAKMNHFSSTKDSATKNTSSNISSANSSSNKEIIKIDIPSTDNGLIHIQNDTKLTASIDCYIMSQVKLCCYESRKDSIAYLRQKPLPEGYPGVQCMYCDKQWFFNSAVQLATGFPKIEQHLSGACDHCPRDLKRIISIAKGQEDVERYELRMETGGKVTRRQYAKIVIERLGAPSLG